MLQVEVRVFGGLENFLSESIASGQSIKVEVPVDATIRVLLDRLGIPAKHVFFVLVNGRCANTDTILSPGDQICLFPLIDGG